MLVPEHTRSINDVDVVKSLVFMVSEQPVLVVLLGPNKVRTCTMDLFVCVVVLSYLAPVEAAGYYTACFKEIQALFTHRWMPRSWRHTSTCPGAA